jgi:hypothetical protein
MGAYGSYSKRESARDIETDIAAADFHVAGSSARGELPSMLRELHLSYAVLSEDRWCGFASAVREPSPGGPPYRALIDPAGQILRPRHVTSAPAQAFHLAGPAASQAGPEGHQAASRAVR